MWQQKVYFKEIKNRISRTLYGHKNMLKEWPMCLGVFKQEE